MNQIRELVAGTPRLKIKRPLPLSFCQGCQHGAAARVIWELLEELGLEDRTIFIGGVTCGSVNAILTDVDCLAPVAHGRAPDIASGMRRLVDDDTIIITYQGDGDAIAIGTESLVQAAARSEKITVFMINNANYGTTGGQMAPTTILGQRTSTTPLGRGKNQEGFPINAAELVAGLAGTAYSARGSLTSPANYGKTKKYVKKALQKQIEKVGFSFVEILSACPPNWGMTPLESLKWIDTALADQFPLGEFKDVDSLE
ncbi:MAG: thiamine pyrophosphate-dependent enzyme [Pseudomonadota bacterium]